MGEGRGWRRVFHRRRVRRWAVFVAVGLLVWLASSFAVAYKLTRRARPPFTEPAPAVAWGRFESHRLATRDGQAVGAWFLPDRGGDAPSVVLLHGNGGSRRQCLNIAEIVAAEGCAVLLVS